MIREFHIGEVLSITTGRLLSLQGMKGLYDILNFMTGDSLFTHQLPRAGERCQPALFAQYPELKNVDVEGVNPENFPSKLLEFTEQYGEYLAVISLDEWEHKDPYGEAVETKGKDRVIVVEGG